jgi:SAM-dependent MidA family methyltransferase
MTAIDLVRGEIARRGPIPFDEVVAAALYDPDGGFYATGGAAGRGGGDFITSPETGPLYGVVVAGALDAWWRDLGEPDPFVAVDAGAGPGTLARTVLAARPACAPALRYVLVERSAAQRQRHADRLRLDDPAFAFAPVDPDVEAPPTLRGQGPIVVSLAELPRVAGPVVILANELLDNLPFGLAERADSGGWREVLVGANDDGDLVEVLVPASPEQSAELDRLAPDALPGARVPVQHAARRWLRDALALAADGGRVVAIDYCTTTSQASQRPQEEWLRTYREHQRGAAPLDRLGAQDITCEVAVDQLALVRAPTSNTAQGAWLRAHGIDDLVAEGKQLWEANAANPDVAALTARSRSSEAAALLDESGLGAFRVLEWLT